MRYSHTLAYTAFNIIFKPYTLNVQCKKETHSLTHKPKHTLAYRSDNIFDKIDVFSHLFDAVHVQQHSPDICQSNMKLKPVAHSQSLPFNASNRQMGIFLIINFCALQIVHIESSTQHTHSFMHSPIRSMCVCVSLSQQTCSSIHPISSDHHASK